MKKLIKTFQYLCNPYGLVWGLLRVFLLLAVMLRAYLVLVDFDETLGMEWDGNKLYT